MSDDRLTDLEIRLTHHERTIEDLSEVIARQQGEIDRLNLLLRRLIDRVQGLEMDGGRSPQDDRPPPHY